MALKNVNLTNVLSKQFIEKHINELNEKDAQTVKDLLLKLDEYDAQTLEMLSSLMNCSLSGSIEQVTEQNISRQHSIEQINKQIYEIFHKNNE